MASKKKQCTECGAWKKDLNKHKPYCKGEVVETNKKEVTAPNVVTSTTDVETSGVVGDSFKDLAKQADAAMQELKIEPDEMGPKLQKPTEPAAIQPKQAIEIFDAKKAHKDLANSIHAAMNDLIKLASKNEIKIGAEQLDRLNDCGAAILAKYDKDGTLAKITPEIAYVLTLMDVGALVFLEWKKKQPKDKPTDTTQAQTTGGEPDGATA